MFSSTYPTFQNADAVPPPTFSSAYQSPAWRFEGGEGVGYTHSTCYYHYNLQQESGYSYNNTYQREPYANHNYPPWLYNSQDYGYDHYISPSPQYVHPPADNFPSPAPPPPHYPQPPASTSEPPDPPDVMDTLISMLRRLEARIDASEQRWSRAQAHPRLSRSLPSSSWVLPPAWAEPEEVIGSGLAKARDDIWGKEEPNEVTQESWRIASYAGDAAVEILEVKAEPDVGLEEGEQKDLSGDDGALVLSGGSNLISDDTSEFKSHVANEEPLHSMMAYTKVKEEPSFHMENKRVILVPEDEKQHIGDKGVSGDATGGTEHRIINDSYDDDGRTDAAREVKDKASKDNAPIIDVVQIGSLMVLGKGLLSADKPFVMKASPVSKKADMDSKCGANGLGEDALALFEQSTTTDFAPTGEIFLTDFEACAAADVIAAGSVGFDSMQTDFGLSPGIESYGRLVDVRGKSLKQARCESDQKLVRLESLPWSSSLPPSDDGVNDDLSLFMGSNEVEGGSLTLADFDRVVAAAKLRVKSYAFKQKENIVEWKKKMEDILIQIRCNGVTKGAGTSDDESESVDILQLILFILAHSFDRSLGGRNFNEALFQYLVAKFKEGYQIAFYQNEQVFLRLHDGCGKLQKVLRANPEASLAIDQLVQRSAHPKLCSSKLD